MRSVAARGECEEACAIGPEPRTLWYVRLHGISADFPLLALHSSDTYGGVDPRVEVNTLHGRSGRLLHTESNTVSGSFLMTSATQTRTVLANASIEDVTSAIQRVVGLDTANVVNASRSPPTLQRGYTWEILLDTENYTFECHKTLQELSVRGEGLSGKGTVVQVEVSHEVFSANRTIHLSVTSAPGSLYAAGSNHSSSSLEHSLADDAAVNEYLGGLRFIPELNWNSYVEGLDAQVNLSINDNTIQTINVHVDAVNDPPVINLPGETYGSVMEQDGLSLKPIRVIPFEVVEDMEVLINGISLRDVDAREAKYGARITDAPEVIKVTLGTTHGTLQLSREAFGTNVSFYAKVEEANARLRELRYKPFLDYHGNDTLYITVDDLGNYGSKERSYVTTATLPIVVTPVPDLLHLELPHALQECDEDSGLPLESWSVRDADVLNGGEEQVTLSVLSESGRVWLDEDFNASTREGNTTITGLVEDVNRALKKAIYYPALNANTLGRSPQVLQLVATRGQLTTTGRVFLQVKAVNDAPTIWTKAMLETMEDTAIPIEETVRVNDVDVHEGGSGTLQVNLTVQTGSFRFSRDPTGVSATSGSNSNKSMQIQGRLEAVNLATARLVYVPVPDWSGTDYITIDVSDLGNTGEGGALTSRAIMPIVVHPVNDAPRWHLPEVADASSVSQVYLSDVDAFSGELTVRVTARRGLLTMTGIAAGVREMEVNGTVDQVNLQLRQLQYVSRGSPDEVTFIAEDHGHTGSGGSEISHAVLVVDESLPSYGPRVYSKQGTVLVGKPCVTIQTLSAHDWAVPEDDVCMNVVEVEEMVIQEDEAMRLNDLSISDPMDEAQRTYILRVVAQRGMLSPFSSSSFASRTSSLRFTSTLAVLNVSLANVLYHPPIHWHGLDQVRIVLQSTEEQGMSVPAAVNITVPIRIQSADDKPQWVLHRTAAETVEDNFVRVEGVQLRAPDTGKLLVVDVEVQNGTVTLGEVDGGLNVVSGSSTMASSIRFRARQRDVNQALKNLLYMPRSEWSGVDLISLTLHTKSHLVACAIAVTVHPMNDSPQLEHRRTGMVTVFQGKASILPRVHASDIDDEVLTLTVAAKEGTVQLDSTLPLFVLQQEARLFEVKGLKETLNEALGSIQYTAPGDYYGNDTVTITLADVQGALATALINLTVTRGNLPPRLTFPAFNDLSTLHELNQGEVFALGTAQSSAVHTVQRGDWIQPQLWRSEILKPDKRRRLSWRYAAVSDGMAVPPRRLVVAQGRIVYAATHDETNGQELWSTDGSAAGSRLVMDARPGSASSEASWVTEHEGRVFFAADGVDTSWRLLSDDCSGLRQATSPLLSGVSFVTARETTWVIGKQYDCPSGFYSMSTEEYEEVVEQGKGLDSDPVYTDQCGWTHMTWEGEARRRFRFADSRETGAYVDASSKELDPLRYDFETLQFAGLICRRHPDTGSGKSCPGNCHATAGMELWVSDLTETVRVADINPSELSSAPSHLASFRGSVYFQATSETYGAELWMSNGTLASTVQVFDIALGLQSSSPQHLVASKDDTVLFFQANDGIHGAELWVSDGQATFLGIGEHREAFHRGEDSRNEFEGAGGTFMVIDLWPGPESSAPAEIVPISETHILFAASTASTGRELWTSDGTASGTRVLLDVLPGSQSSDPAELTLLTNSSLYFSASSEHGWRELHVLHFACCPITIVEHRRIESEAAQGSFPENLLAVKDLLLFNAIDRAGSRELTCLSARSDNSRPCFQETRGAIEVLGPAIALNDMAYFIARSRERLDSAVVDYVRPPGAIRVMDGTIDRLQLIISCDKGTLSTNGTAHGRLLSLTGLPRELNGALATLRYQANWNATGADAIMFTLTAFRPDLGFTQSTEERIDVFIRPRKHLTTP